MRWLFLALAALYVEARAEEDVAQSGMECAHIAHMALVAKALAEEQLSPRMAHNIMTRIYTFGGVIESERMTRIMGRVIGTAFRLQDTAAHDFSNEVYMHCVRSGGQLEVLGTGG